MNRVTGRVVVRESGAGVADLVVAVYDLDPDTKPEEMFRAISVEPSVDAWNKLVGSRMGSVLTAADVRRSSERKRVLMALENGPLGVKEIVLAAELKSRNAADQLIFKMVKDGEIVRSDRGQYALPEASPPDPSKIVEWVEEAYRETAKLMDLVGLRDMI